MKELEKMSAVELQELAQKAAAMAVEKKEQGKKALRAELEERIKSSGYTLADIFPSAASTDKPVRRSSGSKSRSDLPFKYRHPEDPSLGWTGRGRKPTWLVEYLAVGGKEEDCLVG
ncbi:MAG: H-NS histone family protein [Alkalilacustris sp.]